MDQGQLEAARAVGFEIRNPQRFARNMARLVAETGKAADALVHPHATKPRHFTLHHDLAPFLDTLAQLQQAWLRQPHKAFSAYTKLWHSYLDLWYASMCRWMGLEVGTVGSVANRDPQDARFKDPAWSENPYFNFLKQSYLITSHWAERLVEEVEGLDPHTQNKARFYMKQIV